MKKLMIGLLVGQLMGLNTVLACISDFVADTRFQSKNGDVSILLSEGMSGKKRAVYNFKNDEDGAIGLVALALASKTESEEKLQSYKYQLKLSLTKFINYWSTKPTREVPKSIQTAIFNARKLLAKIQEDKLSENDFEFLAENVLENINKDKSSLKRQHELLVYDEKGQINYDQKMIGTGTTLANQLPKGLFESAIDRSVSRGGLDFLSQGEDNKVASCSAEEGLKSYVGGVSFGLPVRREGIPILIPNAPARAGVTF